jgi:hypothetical protein
MEELSRIITNKYGNVTSVSSSSGLNNFFCKNSLHDIESSEIVAAAWFARSFVKSLCFITGIPTTKSKQKVEIRRSKARKSDQYL